MSGPPAPHLAAASFHLVPALVWGVLAWSYWGWLRQARPPRSGLFWILPLLTSLWSLHYLLHAVIELTPTELGGRAPGLHAVLTGVIGTSVAFSMPMLRHLVPWLAVRAEPPSRRWLAVHYGVATLVALITLVPLRGASRFDGAALGVQLGYCAVMIVLTMRAVRRLARRENWPRTYRVVHGVVPAAFVAGVGVFGVAAGLGLTEVLLGPVTTVPHAERYDVSILAHTAFGLAFAAPFAVTMLGRTIRAVLVAVVSIAATALLHLGFPRVTGHLVDPEVRALLDAAAVALLLLVLVPGRAALEAVIRGVMFRRGRRSRAVLQEFLHTLAPELGARECCRRALEEVVRVMDVRGAAILLDREPTAIACAGLAPAALERVWPRGRDADRLPPRPFEFYSIRDPSLRAALSATGVALVVPITSPRGRWGHLFVAEGVLSHVTQEEQHVETLATFADQLALVLDATDLHSRAVAVERSLAHAEKLAAIGELAARIVHEIRNPVTAARSLAQQLVQEPGVSCAAELGVILGELERVERQVADLLRFARRDELRREPTDLATLVRGTLARFAPRLERAGIAIDLALADGVTVLVDRERVQQVLVNVIENAMDALVEDGADRRLRITVAAGDGTAQLRVSDNGPGVAADAVARLFEPFFSLKAHGTGLGLAIAKRTIDAHGGRIHAERGAPAGMTMHVELPLERA